MSYPLPQLFSKGCSKQSKISALAQISHFPWGPRRQLTRAQALPCAGESPPPWLARPSLAVCPSSLNAMSPPPHAQMLSLQRCMNWPRATRVINAPPSEPMKDLAA